MLPTASLRQAAWLQVAAERVGKHLPFRFKYYRVTAMALLERETVASSISRRLAGIGRH